MRKPPLARRCGFVYASSVPNNSWVKFGFTRRCPHHRIKELSTSNSKDDFVLLDARFVKDALQAEKYLHQKAKSLGLNQKKEFFEATEDQIQILLDSTQEAHSSVFVEKINEASSDLKLEALDVESSDAFFSDDVFKSDYENYSLKVLEKMASCGDAHASFLVAQHLVTQKMFVEAKVMLQASVDQGHETALVHKQFIQSHLVSSTSSNNLASEGLKTLWESFFPFYNRLTQGLDIPKDIEDLFGVEQKSWISLPHRAEHWSLFLKEKQYVSCNKNFNKI